MQHSKEATLNRWERMNEVETMWQEKGTENGVTSTASVRNLSIPENK